MKLAAKWFLWFTGIGIYVMVLGGIFYFNLFKWTFDERLKKDAINMVRLHASTLINGLSRNQGAISMDEFDVVTDFAKDERVAAILYLNKYGEVRWNKDPSKITMSFDDFKEEMGIPTDAIEQAWLSKEPMIRAVPNLPLYDIAIPLAVRGDVLGIFNMQISREGVMKIIDEAMRKYVVGAIGVLLLLGIPLYFFLHHFVINPILTLRDSIEAVSFKSLDLKFPPRNDEIGELANVLGVFLSKVKTELSNTMVREKQRGVAESRWWKTIMSSIITKTSYAIVVDEDNSVLYTNFQHTGAVAEGKMHLLDVIDSQQQDVLRLVGVALDRPNQVVETDTMFKNEQCHVRAVHLDEEGELKRTLVIFEPKKVAPRI